MPELAQPLGLGRRRARAWNPARAAACTRYSMRHVDGDVLLAGRVERRDRRGRGRGRSAASRLCHRADELGAGRPCSRRRTSRPRRNATAARGEPARERESAPAARAPTGRVATTRSASAASSLGRGHERSRRGRRRRRADPHLAPPVVACARRLGTAGCRAARWRTRRRRAHRGELVERGDDRAHARRPASARPSSSRDHGPSASSNGSTVEQLALCAARSSRDRSTST